jgi:hypothetical protein
MANPTTAAIPVDELRLAQLACTKLAGIVQGTVSVGLSGVVTGVPDPRVFLDDQFDVMIGYGRVLHTIAGTPAGQQEIARLRERSQAVLTALAKLRRDLYDYLDAPANATPSLRPARDSAAALCDALGKYGSMVQIDLSRVQRVTEVVLQMFDTVEDIITGRVPPPATYHA